MTLPVSAPFSSGGALQANARAGPPDLLDPADPDWVAFQKQDPDWFLAVAGDAIRDYCGWHIYPNLNFVLTNRRIGSRGLIQVPSLLVTAVNSVTIQDPQGQNPWLLDPAEYTWFANGVIEPATLQQWHAYAGYYYGPDNWSFLPMYQFGYATVDFNSGYDSCPRVIKEIAYELTTVTTEVAAGNVKEIQTPGFRLTLQQAYGATLNADQKNKLAKYRLPTVI